MTMHPLGSPYVRDQLSLRAILLNEKRLQPEGEYILYWMQTTQRFEDNWALRLATLEADRIGKPQRPVVLESLRRLHPVQDVFALGLKSLFVQRERAE